jgi:hypothetical protein
MSITQTGSEYVTCSAVLSPCQQYRYELIRSWGKGDWLAWIGLNPSTADGTEDDPTIRRCVGFSKRFGFAGMVMLNLFAYRSTDPRGMLAQGVNAIGPDNDKHLIQWALACPVVVAAWGAPGVLLGRDLQVQKMLGGVGCSLHCLGKNNSGTPKHPLYLANETPLQLYDSCL